MREKEEGSREREEKKEGKKKRVETQGQEGQAPRYGKPVD